MSSKHLNGSDGCSRTQIHKTQNSLRPTPETNCVRKIICDLSLNQGCSEIRAIFAPVLRDLHARFRASICFLDLLLVINCNIFVAKYILYLVVYVLWYFNHLNDFRISSTFDITLAMSFISYFVVLLFIATYLFLYCK